MDPSAYPDLGPALPCLPEIRHRDMPATLPCTERSPKDRPPGISDDPFAGNAAEKFHVTDAGAFFEYALPIYSAGRWREGLEWFVWVRDWATNDQTGQPIGGRATVWYHATEWIIAKLTGMGFYEEALAMTDEAIAAPHGNTYHGRSRITLGIRRLNILRRLDRAPDDIVAQLRELVDQCEENRHLSIWNHRMAKVSLAHALIHTGEIAEAEALLETLTAGGFQHARWARLCHWVKSGRIEGVEEEFQGLLKRFRETGHKLYECSLYIDYADFLEARGRDREALLMRREVVRLCRSFDIFYRLPVELAKLAALLHRVGDETGSVAAAEEARALLAGGRIPPIRTEKANEFLDCLGKAPVADAPERARGIDLQPLRSVVVPLENAPWTSYLTLTNPGDQSKSGHLRFDGPPVAISIEEETGDITATLRDDEDPGDAELPLTIEPASYCLIRIQGSDTVPPGSELRLSWHAGNLEPSAEAAVSLEAAESGVAGAIIQAGNYRANPFYGVPIHLHYVTKADASSSPPLRFVCSQKTRVEVYLLDGTPLAIDGQGNGSLLDRSDELFTRSDGRGNVLLPLTDGAAAFRIVLYPDGPLPEDGLTIDIEAFAAGTWQPHSRNRLSP